MPYKNKPRPYKKEYQQQKARGEHEDRMERQRARRAMDKKGVDRKGKDVSHKKALSKGGSNSDGVKLESPSKNRSRNYKKKGKGKK
ncbi:MAG TPA: HNH endonuclease [Candidatus Paceibacterota bacterium]|nr:HNH endonuclease [Candidatus Paceibacterota bacterium]